MGTLQHTVARLEGEASPLGRLVARGMITRAISLYLYDVRAFAYWLTTFLPKPALNWLLAARRRYRRLRFSTGKVS